VRSYTERTNPTSDAEHASSQSDRVALPSRGVALPTSQRPWRVVASSPLPARKPYLDFLEQPPVPIWILKRGKCEVGTTFRVTSANAWILHGDVEGEAGVVENLAHIDAARDQVVAGGVDIIHRQDYGVDRTWLGGSNPLAKNDRRSRTGRSELYDPEVLVGIVDIQAKS